MEQRIIQDGKNHIYLPLTQIAKKVGLNRQSMRYWIKQSKDNKGRPIRAFMLAGTIYMSTFHTT